MRGVADEMKFGELLKGLRETSGLTQTALADRAGVPVGSIRNHEQGHRLPSLPHAVRLAKALGVPLDDLVKCDEFAVSDKSKKK